MFNCPLFGCCEKLCYSYSSRVRVYVTSDQCQEVLGKPSRTTRLYLEGQTQTYSQNVNPQKRVIPVQPQHYTPVGGRGLAFICIVLRHSPGTSISVIIDLDTRITIPLSAGVAMVYTMLGQMVSVAYTDIIQLLFIIVGLVSCWCTLI